MCALVERAPFKRRMKLNKSLSEYARSSLKDGLKKCTEGQIAKFKRMYSKDPGQSIDQVVDNMPEEKLDWAMQQVERTLSKQ